MTIIVKILITTIKKIKQMKDHKIQTMNKVQTKVKKNKKKVRKNKKKVKIIQRKRKQILMK